jgi:hypothetical protein
MTFTITDMRKFAVEAWGPFGGDVVERWTEFNAKYFDGKLKPIPLVITQTLPYGHLLAFCSYTGKNGSPGRTITLNVPDQHDRLLADNDTLLHEMIHQCLFERGESAAHKSSGWRKEIMRLHHLITGQDIWAGRSTTVRRKVDGVSKVVRINVTNPDNNTASLKQGEIARWPHSCGICLGTLGSVTCS